MARRVKIATFSVRGFGDDAKLSIDQAADACEEYWKDKLSFVLSDKPDLVVLPECANRPVAFCSPDNADKLKDYYLNHSHRFMDLCAAMARTHATTIVCSCVGVHDGAWRNASTVFGPGGDVLGVYHKNHLVIEECQDRGVSYGTAAPIIETPFGTIGCAICFDLNFDDLRNKYAQSRPDLIVFSSMYHGGGQQIIWPYLCRAHFVGSMGLETLPGEIRNPFGEILYTTTNYTECVVGEINLDCELAHLDYNIGKLEKLKRHYGPMVTIHNPSLYGSVLITSESESVSAAEMVKLFKIERLDDYFNRAICHRSSHV